MRALACLGKASAGASPRRACEGGRAAPTSEARASQTALGPAQSTSRPPGRAARFEAGAAHRPEASRARGRSAVAQAAYRGRHGCSSWAARHPRGAPRAATGRGGAVPLASDVACVASADVEPGLQRGEPCYLNIADIVPSREETSLGKQISHDQHHDAAPRKACLSSRRTTAFPFTNLTLSIDHPASHRSTFFLPPLLSPFHRSVHSRVHGHPPRAPPF